MVEGSLVDKCEALGIRVRLNEDVNKLAKELDESEGR